MKKALQGFWRGGLLGGLLGLLGGVVFFLCLFSPDFVEFFNQGGAVSDLNPEFFSLIQSFIFLPGLFFGTVIGALIGIPLVFMDFQQTWKRIGFSVIFAGFLHMLVVTIFLYVIPQLTFGGIRSYAEYLNYRHLILPIYMIVAILFGYYFPTFKPRWPKFLGGRGQHENGEGLQ